MSWALYRVGIFLVRPAESDTQDWQCEVFVDFGDRYAFLCDYGGKHKESSIGDLLTELQEAPRGFLQEQAVNKWCRMHTAAYEKALALL